MYVYMYMYIYIYIERERERERGREREINCLHNFLAGGHMMTTVNTLGTIS